MNPNLKKRIESINKGIIPEGYKKTKVGIVPVEWEVNQLSKYIVEYTEKTTINNQYPVLTSSRKGLMLQSEYFNNHQVTTEDNIGYNVLPRGYITFRSRTDDGNFRFNLNEIIDKGIVSYFYPVFDFSEKVDKTYMLNLLNFTIYKKYYPYVEGTAQQVMSIKKLGKLYFEVPPLPEQQKIAEILSTQDKLIELHEKKVEKLKELKKAYLQKMFPKKGSKYPELRFKGFTDAWEQRKLGDLCREFQSGKSIKASDIYEIGEYAVYGGNGLRGYTNSYNHDGEFALIGRQGALCGNMNYSTGKAYFTEHAVAVHGNADNDTLFLYYLLDLMNLGQYSGQSAQPGLAVNKIIQLKTKIPKLDEQRLISSFFKQLDTLITLHQRKSEQEKQKKKALMQLLLTGKVRCI